MNNSQIALLVVLGALVLGGTSALLVIGARQRSTMLSRLRYDKDTHARVLAFVGATFFMLLVLGRNQGHASVLGFVYWYLFFLLTTMLVGVTVMSWAKRRGIDVTRHPRSVVVFVPTVAGIIVLLLVTYLLHGPFSS